MTDDMLAEIESLFRDYGVPARGRGRRFPDPVKSHILKLMQSGVNLSTLARATGISLVTLKHWKEKMPATHFHRIAVVDRSAPCEVKLRLYITEQTWLELDEAAIQAGILQKIRSSL